MTLNTDSAKETECELFLVLYETVNMGFPNGLTREQIMEITSYLKNETSMFSSTKFVSYNGKEKSVMIEEMLFNFPTQSIITEPQFDIESPRYTIPEDYSEVAEQTRRNLSPDERQKIRRYINEALRSE